MLSKYRPQTPANTASKHKLYCKHSHSSLGVFFLSLNAPPDAHPPSAADASHALLVTFYLLSALTLDFSQSGYWKNIFFSLSPSLGVLLLLLSLSTAAVVIFSVQGP